MADWIGPQDGPRPELLVPVPLHAERIRERGFNQAIEIARIVGRRMQIPVAARAAVRYRATPPQVDLPREQRLRNLRGAFSVEIPPGIRHVALVDDVVTTGATTSELARVLKRAGAETVEAWAIARTDAKSGSAPDRHPPPETAGNFR